jgi:hypothetical protein
MSKAAERLPLSSRLVGPNITDQPLTRWVCEIDAHPGYSSAPSLSFERMLVTWQRGWDNQRRHVNKLFQWNLSQNNSSWTF